MKTKWSTRILSMLTVLIMLLGMGMPVVLAEDAQPPKTAYHYFAEDEQGGNALSSGEAEAMPIESTYQQLTLGRASI